MIEAFQLKGIKNHEIKYLNKNFNHYPKPYESWSILKEHGLNMPLSVKNGYIYFQPVQGDINFLVSTEFFKRKVLKPIKAWKSPATTPLAIKNMHMQEVGLSEVEINDLCKSENLLGCTEEELMLILGLIVAYRVLLVMALLFCNGAGVQ